MRRTIDLNCGWEFALHRGFEPVTKEEAEHLSYTRVDLPHDWAIDAPFNRDMKQGETQGFRDRWGIGWYKKKLFLPEMHPDIYKLCFDGIYENSTVYVNGILAGGRKYGYSSFSLDITEVLKTGLNEILVKVDNTAFPADRWYSGAGIYRKVSLLILPKEHLSEEDIHVKTAADGSQAVLTIHTGIRKPVTAFLEKNGRKYTASGSEGVIELNVEDCVLWSAQRPELYDLTLQLHTNKGVIEDQIFMKIGVRDAELSADRGLFVNGMPVKLKGICIHQEAGCFGTGVQKEIWRERLLRIKETGCNAIRLAHHIFMPEILDLCDEIGFYVYEECFDKWTGGAYGRYYQEEWENDLTCMVRRDRNHPCILFWGVGNEVENQAYDSMLEMLERHTAKVRELDQTRPVSVAMNPHFAYPSGEVDMTTVSDIQQFVDEMKTGEIFNIDDRVEQIKRIADKVDFLCCNYQEQWYDRIHQAIPDKAILGTETYLYFRGFEDNFQNFTDRNPWWDVEERPYCIGGMIWTGIDYLGESMCYPAKGWSGALFSTDMEKRPMAWLYQSYWTEEPMIHFAVMDYTIPDEAVKEHWDSPRYVTHWEFPQFNKTVIPYMIATNCEEVELAVNGRNILIKPVTEFPNHMVTGFLPYLPGTVTVIGKNQGLEVCRHVVKTPGMAVKLAFEREEMQIGLETVRGLQKEETVKPYQLLLKVRAYDRDDNPVFRESGKVQFRVEGPARIAGVDNGDICGAEPYGNDVIHLFRGKAAVALMITGTGRICITAYAGGMSAARTVVTAFINMENNEQERLLE